MKTEVLIHLVRPHLLGTIILLVFTGCGANHVGEAWQCPLAQGTQCASVESVDPAVRPALREIALPPLEALTTTAPVPVESTIESRGTAVAGRVDRARPAPCQSSCNPLGRFWHWLAGGESADPTTGEAEPSESLAASTNPAFAAQARDEVQTASSATAPISARLESVAGEGRADESLHAANAIPIPATSPVTDTETAAENSAAGSIAAARPVAEQLDSRRDVAPEPQDIPDTDLVTDARPITPGHTPIASLDEVRIPEKIGRIWIAPWVDANGVYREGAWVRVVISAATWRRP